MCYTAWKFVLSAKSYRGKIPCVFVLLHIEEETITKRYLLSINSTIHVVNHTVFNCVFNAFNTLTVVGNIGDFPFHVNAPISQQIICFHISHNYELAMRDNDMTMFSI